MSALCPTEFTKAICVTLGLKLPVRAWRAHQWLPNCVYCASLLLGSLSCHSSAISGRVPREPLPSIADYWAGSIGSGPVPVSTASVFMIAMTVSGLEDGIYNPSPCLLLLYSPCLTKAMLVSLTWVVYILTRAEHSSLFFFLSILCSMGLCIHLHSPQRETSLNLRAAFLCGYKHSYLEGDLILCQSVNYHSRFPLWWPQTLLVRRIVPGL